MDVHSGESYLFYYTDVPHRKFMVGTVVTVRGAKSGSHRAADQQGILSVRRTPKRFKLTNGSYANAGELKPLPTTGQPITGKVDE